MENIFSFMCGDVWNGKWNKWGFLTTDLGSNMLTIFLIFIAHWYLSLFVQTFFLHRYASHQMFTTSKFMEKVFFVVTLLAQGSSFLRPSAYALMHRDHHKFSDTEKDPHSPAAFKNIFSFMLKTAKEYRYFTDLALERKDDKSLPRWTAFENIVSILLPKSVVRNPPLCSIFHSKHHRT